VTEAGAVGAVSFALGCPHADSISRVPITVTAAATRFTRSVHRTVGARTRAKTEADTLPRGSRRHAGQSVDPLNRRPYGSTP
jgi:hypothetical protein